jgi:hypothetical protein
MWRSLRYGAMQRYMGRWMHTARSFFFCHVFLQAPWTCIVEVHWIGVKVTGVFCFQDIHKDVSKFSPGRFLSVRRMTAHSSKPPPHNLLQSLYTIHVILAFQAGQSRRIVHKYNIINRHRSQQPYGVVLFVLRDALLVNGMKVNECTCYNAWTG